MSDTRQTIVDLEARPREAKALAEKVRLMLVTRGIIAAARTPCVLGSDAGHAPGPRFSDACSRGAERGFARLMTTA